MNKIKICDAIMGTGKSQSAITYMNEHSDEKFIYITPFLDEATRIKEACPALNFIEPKKKNAEGGKIAHSAKLISEGKNITTTHQAFRYYTSEMIDSIRRHEYTLIIDENVDVLTKLKSDFYDIEMALDAGLLTEDNGVLRLTDKKYRGTALSELFDILEGHDLMKMLSDEPNALFFWMLPKELLTSFKNVFVLTYLFEAQSLHHFFHMYNIPYEYIGVERTNTGNGYRFCEHQNYVPEYVTRIKDMIHIMDNPKLNSVGDHPQALSLTWFKRGGEKPAQLKRNIHNIIQNIWKGVPRTQKMWGTFKSAKEKMKGVGYTKLYLNFNHRASNDYRDRTHLLYIVNIYMNVDERNFYQHHGIEVNEDMYALSTMVQWIWRSAIRDGKEIELYMPSSRMRRILTEWMNSF